MGLGNKTRKSDRKMGRRNLPKISDWELVLGSLTGKGLSQFPWYPKNSLLSCTVKEFPKKLQFPWPVGHRPGVSGCLCPWCSQTHLDPYFFEPSTCRELELPQGTSTAQELLQSQQCPKAPSCSSAQSSQFLQCLRRDWDEQTLSCLHSSHSC